MYLFWFCFGFLVLLLKGLPFAFVNTSFFLFFYPQLIIKICIFYHSKAMASLFLFIPNLLMLSSLKSILISWALYLLFYKYQTFKESLIFLLGLFSWKCFLLLVSLIVSSLWKFFQYWLIPHLSNQEVLHLDYVDKDISENHNPQFTSKIPFVSIWKREDFHNMFPDELQGQSSNERPSCLEFR